MLKISRVARVFARVFAQEAPPDALATYRADDPHDDQNQGEVAETALASFPPNTSTSGAQERRLTPARNRSGAFSRQNGAAGDPRALLVQNQCLKLCLNIFNRAQRHTRSLGFTSAIPGEGKTFLATVAATTLAKRSHRPVTLVDCNWENPEVHERFGVPNSPGLAEWLRRECDLAEIRHTVSPSLTVIPCGDDLQDSLALAERFRAIGSSAILTSPDELMIVDLPSVLTTDYSAIVSASLDAVLLVVRAGVTQEAYIAEANRELSDAAVEGAVLNATHSSIPRWLLRLL